MDRRAKGRQRTHAPRLDDAARRTTSTVSSVLADSASVVRAKERTLSATRGSRTIGHALREVLGAVVRLHRNRSSRAEP